MVDLSIVQKDEDAGLVKLVQDYMSQGDHIKALEVIEDSFSVRGIQKLPRALNFLEGSILFEQGMRREDSDLKFAFLLSSGECYLVDNGVNDLAAMALFELAKHLDSALYYRKAMKDAKANLSFLASFDRLSLADEDTKRTLENILEVAGSKIRLGVTGKVSEPKVREAENVQNRIRSDSNTVEGKRMKSYWAGMDAESKKNFVKVSIAELGSYVERLYGREGQDALEKVLDSARTQKKWKFWMCRTCSQKFFYQKKFKNHLEQKHAAKFKPSTTKHMAQRVDQVWAGMLLVGDWEPVDTVAAAEMISTRLEFVKAFVYEKGWSRDWPLAADGERGKLLKDIQLLLVSFEECKILSCGIRDWMMRFVIRHLAQFEVSEHVITTECRLVETPQSICFLECRELNQVVDLLKLIKCERDDGADLVSRAVDSSWGRTRVKEKIEIDDQFSFMLLDKRLLRGEISSFDDEGTIDFCGQNVYYAKTHPQGDDFITWLLDFPLLDESFEFPRSIRAYNLDIWVAVLRAIHFTCRDVGAKYAKKLNILGYDAGLVDAINLCVCENKRRNSIPEHQWNKYASLLGNECEERVTKDPNCSLNTHLFLCAVKDVLEGASHPTFYFPDLEDCLKLIHGHRNVSDEKVSKSMDLLRSVVANKVPLADSKILLVENSRISLLNDLIRLSVFDHRSYILNLLKRFLRDKLDGIVDMDTKAKVAAAEADLLSEKKQEKEKNLGSKKRKHGNKKVVEDLNSLFASLTFRVLSCKNEWSSLRNRELRRACLVFMIRRSNMNILSTSNRKVRIRKKMLWNQNVLSQVKRLEWKFHPPLTFKKLLLKICKPCLERIHCPVNILSTSNRKVRIYHKIRGKKMLWNQNVLFQVERLEWKLHPPLTFKKKLLKIYKLCLERIHCRNLWSQHLEKALCNIKVLKEYLVQNRHQFPDNLEEQVPFALRNFFAAFASNQIKEEGLYSYLLGSVLASLEEAHFMSNNASELLVAILESWPCWKIPEIESVVTHLFTLEEYERMSCSRCRKKPNYPEQSSYGIVTAADSIRDWKSTFGNIKFEDILKVIRMEEKMLCDIKTGGCGKTDFVHHIITTCPPIFTIVLEWEKDETEKEISETTNALEWEIDMSRLYEGLQSNTKYRLVSMVGSGDEDGEHICMAFKKNRWVSFRHEALAKKAVGNWKSVVRFCGETKFRPEILFYEAVLGSLGESFDV